MSKNKNGSASTAKTGAPDAASSVEPNYMEMGVVVRGKKERRATQEDEQNYTVLGEFSSLTQEELRTYENKNASALNVEPNYVDMKTPVTKGNKERRPTQEDEQGYTALGEFSSLAQEALRKYENENASILNVEPNYVDMKTPVTEDNKERRPTQEDEQGYTALGEFSSLAQEALRKYENENASILNVEPNYVDMKTPVTKGNKERRPTQEDEQGYTALGEFSSLAQEALRKYENENASILNVEPNYVDMKTPIAEGEEQQAAKKDEQNYEVPFNLSESAHEEPADPPANSFNIYESASTESIKLPNNQYEDVDPRESEGSINPAGGLRVSQDPMGERTTPNQLYRDSTTFLQSVSACFAACFSPCCGRN